MVSPSSSSTAPRLLITGGAGFIGSTLARAARGAGYRVRVLDDLSGASIGGGDAAPVAPGASVERLEHLESLEGVELLVGSVLDRRCVVRALEGCDAVVHLAARVGVKRVVDAPAETLAVNAIGTRLVTLEAARRGLRLLNASSSEVLGVGVRRGAGARPMREDDPPLAGIGPSSRWSYAVSKLAGERLVAECARVDGLRGLSVRFFNTTGPGQSADSGMVLPRMVADAIERGRIVVHGDGQQVRSFCSVDDVVRALLALLGADRGLWDGRIFHLGNDRPVTIAQLAGCVAERTGAVIEHASHTSVFGRGFEDVRLRVPDLTRATEALGWRPKVDLDELVDRCVAGANGVPTVQPSGV